MEPQCKYRLVEAGKQFFNIFIVFLKHIFFHKNEIIRITTTTISANNELRLMDEERDSTYIQNLEQLVMEQTIVISDLKKDVAQINASIKEIKKMLTEPKEVGHLDRSTYHSFPIANDEDLEKVDELLENPTNRENIVRFSFCFDYLILI